MKTPLLALLAVVTILSTFGCDKTTPPGYHLYSWFRTVQNLKPGDSVIMAGGQIGDVESIALDPAKAEMLVTLLIKRPVVVKTDSTVTINSVPSPGRSSIVLDGGSPSAPAAPESATLKTREKPSSEHQTRSDYRSPSNSRATLVEKP